LRTTCCCRHERAPLLGKRDRPRTPTDLAASLEPLSVDEVNVPARFTVTEWALLALHRARSAPDERREQCDRFTGGTHLETLSGSVLTKLGETAMALRQGGAMSTRLEDQICARVLNEMRKLEAAVEPVRHSPEAGRVADLTRRDERDARGQWAVM
jgi:hypothetical protein